MHKASAEKVLHWLSANRVSLLPVEVEQWKRRGLWLPKDAEVKLSSHVANTVPERTVRILVPCSVDASIRIESRGSPGRGILPPEVVVDLADLQYYSTYSIVVTMRSRFEWLSAASPDMPAFKEWMSFVFTRLEQLNSDSPSSEPIVPKRAGS